MAIKIVTILVGTPENDKEIAVSSDKTIAAVLSENNIAQAGSIQLNGRTLNSSELGKTLDQLSVTDGNCIYVVRKMDGAKG